MGFLAKIFQLVLMIPSIAGWIGDLWKIYVDAKITKANEKKSEQLKKDIDALKKAQESGDVESQKNALDSVINDGNS